MTASVMVTARLPRDLVDSLEAQIPRLAAKCLPGVRVTRTDALRLILTEALARAEAEQAGSTVE